MKDASLNATRSAESQSDDIWTAEKWIQSGDARLLLRVARLRRSVAAEVVLTHGLGEHSARYSHVAQVLAEQGLRVWAYDLRGHGHSSGRRGDARRYEDLLGDLEAVYREALAEGRPIFFLGHSMGAQITLNFLLSRRIACAGAVIASPWLRLAFDPPHWRRWLAEVAARVFPVLTQSTLSLPEQLSRDPAHVAALAEPHLGHHVVSARLYLILRAEGLRALRCAEDFEQPVLLVHGGADKVTSCTATKEFFDRAGSTDKELVVYPEAVHETHNDLGRERVLERMAEWMTKRAVGAGSQGRTGVS